MRRLLAPLLLLLLVAPAPAMDADVLRAKVPREWRVSLGRDHLFVLMQSHVDPGDLDLPDWSSFDRDGNGSLGAAELAALVAEAHRRETAYACVAVAGVVLPLGRLSAKAKRPQEGPFGLDETLLLQVQGRTELDLPVGDSPFVVYDHARRDDGVVPVRLSAVAGFGFARMDGARAELRSERRLEIALSRRQPGAWGVVQKAAAAGPGGR